MTAFALGLAALGGGAAGTAGAVWLRTGRYRRDGDQGRLSWNPLVLLPVLTAAVWMLLTAVVDSRAALPAILAYAAAGLVLSWIDLDVHRLPDVLVATSGGLVLAFLGGAAATTSQWGRLGLAVVAGAVLAVVFLVLAMVTTMGFGDVKAAGVAGMMLGWFGWPAVLTGVVAGFVVAGLVGLILLVARRVQLGSHLAFGPALIAGTLITVAYLG